MLSQTVSSELRRYEDLSFDIITQCKILREKRERIDTIYQNGELQTVWMMNSWSAAESLQRRENILQDDRKRLYDIDTAIVSLYLKMLSLQSCKVDSVKRMLEDLFFKNPSDNCPADYTVQAYQEWTRTSPKIHALQSEVLDLLSQKIRLNKLILGSDVKKHTTRNSNLSTSTIEKLRSQTFFFIEKDPLVDTEFTLHVSKYVSTESNTFEGMKMREFIHEIWELDETSGVDNTYSDYYQEFVGALTEHVLTKYGHMRRSGHSKTDITRDQIYAIVEGHLIQHIFDCIFDEDPGDVILREKYKSLSSLDQLQIGIKKEYIDQSLIPYHDAIIKLKSVQVVMLPTQKLRAIILASQAVMKRMMEICTKSNVIAGADEFMDVWVYVVLQTGIKNLFTNLNFLKSFCNPSYMLSETGYYLSSLELAAEFIRNADKEELLKNITNTQNEYLFATIEKITKFQDLNRKNLCDFEISEERFALQGYQPVACLEWLQNPCCLMTTAFTRSSSDQLIHISLLKTKSTTSLEYIKQLLYHNQHTYLSFEVIRNDNKRIFVPVLTNETKEAIPLTSVLISNLDTDISLFTNYSHLSCFRLHTLLTTGICTNSELQLAVQNLKQEFNDTYGYIFKHQPVQQALQQVQAVLTNLGYYSKLLHPDNFLEVLLKKSVTKFQQDQSRDGKKMLCVDGLINVDVLRLLGLSAPLEETVTTNRNTQWKQC